MTQTVEVTEADAMCAVAVFEAMQTGDKSGAEIVARYRLTTQPTPSDQQAEASALHPILASIAAEVEKATSKFPTWPTRIIDAGNVVSEEAGELAKACLQVTYEKHKETLDGVREEAIQTAAMCIRFLASMNRYDCEPAEQHEQPAFAALTGDLK